MSVRVSMKFCVKQEGALEQMENFTADVPEDKGGAGYGGTVKTEKTENYSVSFLRGVGCIGVILIHFRFPGYLGGICSSLAEFAVPFFFMTAGYYACHEDGGKEEQKLKKRIRNTFRITCISVLIYLCYRVLIVRQPWEVISLMQILLWNNLDCIHGLHLWFLPALLYSYLFVYGLCKTGLLKWAYRLVPVLFCVRLAVIMDPRNDWHMAQNFLFCGIPYMMLGHWFARKREQTITHMGTAGILAAAIGGWVLNYGGSVLGCPSVFVEIGNIIYSVALFLLAMKKPSRHINLRIESIGKTSSLYIYIIHMLVGTFVSLGFRLLHLAGKPGMDYVAPVTIIVVSVAFAQGIYRLSLWWKCKDHNDRGGQSPQK